MIRSHAIFAASFLALAVPSVSATLAKADPAGTVVPAAGSQLPVDDSSLIVDKGSWPIVDQAISVALPAVKSMTHVYHLNGKSGNQFWLQVSSKDFPPEIVLNSHGKLSMPFGSFMPPDGLPTDEYGREVSLTFQRDGQWITAVELSLQEDQEVVLLVGRAVSWQVNGQGGDVNTTGNLGGSYQIAGNLENL